jgi:hypothetical protein
MNQCKFIVTISQQGGLRQTAVGGVQIGIEVPTIQDLGFWGGEVDYSEGRED